MYRSHRQRSPTKLPTKPALGFLTPGLLLLGLLTACNSTGAVTPLTLTYTNPLPITKPDGSKVQSCADPSVIQSRVAGDRNWYLYCTTDPHNAGDVDAGGNLNFHLMSVAKSADLVNWSYIGDVFQQRPAWVKADAGLWAPDIECLNSRYSLYYTASDTVAGGSAIGVATSSSPATRPVPGPTVAGRSWNRRPRRNREPTLQIAAGPTTPR